MPRQQLDTQAAAVRQDEAAVKSDQGQVDAAKLNLTYSRITAPITGRWACGLVDPGNIVHASDQRRARRHHPAPADRGRASPFPPTSLPPVLAQMRGGRKLVVEANDRDMKKKLASGTLSAVDNQIDTTTGTVRLKAEFETLTALSSRISSSTRGSSSDDSPTSCSSPRRRSSAVPSRPSCGSGTDSSVEMRNVAVQLTEGDRVAIAGPVKPGELLRGGRRRQAAAGLEGRRISAGRAGAAVPARGKTC